MKKIITTLIVTSMFALNTTTVFAESNNIKITINNEAVEFTDAKPYVDNNGRTMIPVAKIGELLGVNVGWNNDTQTVTLKDGDNTVALKLNVDSITINGVTSKMDTKAVSKNGRTYVPVSAIAKAFGVNTGWDKVNSTVNLTSNKVVEKTENTGTSGNVATPNTGATEGKTPKLSATFSDTVEENGLKLTATVRGEGNDIWFDVNTNVPTKRYHIVGKSENFEKDILSVEALKNYIDNLISGQKYRYFKDSDYFGSISYDSAMDEYYLTSGKTGFSIPSGVEIGEEYTAKILCETKTGETTGVITFNFVFE